MIENVLQKTSSQNLYRQQRERYLFLQLTNACNLRCKHCYVGNERLDTNRHFKLDNIEDILDYFRSVYAHDKLYILGGEPTLHPNFSDIVKMANNKGYFVTVSSNGHFSQEIFDTLSPEEVASWNFSLDGPDEATHSLIRGNRRNYYEVLEKIEFCQKNGYQVRINTTVSNLNHSRALDMITFVANLGVDILSFHNLGLTGNATHQLIPLRPQEWMNFTQSIEDHGPVGGLSVYYPPSFIKRGDISKYLERGYPGCPARNFDRPYLYSDGTVYSCPLFMNNKESYGVFTDGKLKLNSSESGEMYGLMNNSSICNKCDSNRSCGGCPAYDVLPEYKEWYKCDKEIIPLCMLWTTYAWNDVPSQRKHQFR